METAMRIGSILLVWFPQTIIEVSRGRMYFLPENPDPVQEPNNGTAKERANL